MSGICGGFDSQENERQTTHTPAPDKNYTHFNSVIGILREGRFLFDVN